jgi:hypothetical protein
MNLSSVEREYFAKGPPLNGCADLGVVQWANLTRAIDV